MERNYIIIQQPPLAPTGAASPEVASEAADEGEEAEVDEDPVGKGLP